MVRAVRSIRFIGQMLPGESHVESSVAPIKYHSIDDRDHRMDLFCAFSITHTDLYQLSLRTLRPPIARVRMNAARHTREV